MVDKAFYIPDMIEWAGEQEADQIDMGAVMITMMAPFHKGISLSRYESSFKKNVIAVKQRFEELIGAGAENDLGTRLAALKFCFVEIQNFQMADSNAERLETADILRVIDTGFGCASALSLLYMDAARKNGWRIEGMDFPKNFLCRMEKDGQRIIFDPAQGCRILEAHDLRALLKEALGDEAELASHYFDGFDARATMVHIGNRLKIRYIEMADYRKALHLNQMLCALAPDDYQLLFDAGVLYMRCGENAQAMNALEDYIDQAPLGSDTSEAYVLLSELTEELS